MKQGVLYARVSSREQEREGFSIPAQLKLLREYAGKHSLTILREFIDVEPPRPPDASSSAKWCASWKNIPSAA